MPRLVPQYQLAAISQQLIFGSFRQHFVQRHCENIANKLEANGFDVPAGIAQDVVKELFAGLRLLVDLTDAFA